MARLQREAWVEAGFAALCEAGVEDVRINPLCARLGVTKGSFYWHFTSRDALLHALLEVWEQQGTESIITAVDGADTTAAQRVELLITTVFAEDPQTDRIEPAIRAWAANDENAAAVVARVDERRLAYVRDLLVATGLSRAVATHRSALVYRALIGEFTWRSHGGPPLSKRALAQLGRMVLDHDG
ncbi:MAG: TetR/AcrR family transcriptional regulator [Deltaproteobacteria bacterium]|nr:TetR/AcrR family transcriptional regulator [Deltaproteobacteria bacterium]